MKKENFGVKSRFATSEKTRVSDLTSEFPVLAFQIGAKAAAQQTGMNAIHTAYTIVPGTLIVKINK